LVAEGDFPDEVERLVLDADGAGGAEGELLGFESQAGVMDAALDDVDRYFLLRQLQPLLGSAFGGSGFGYGGRRAARQKAAGNSGEAIEPDLAVGESFDLIDRPDQRARQRARADGDVVDNELALGIEPGGIVD